MTAQPRLPLRQLAAEDYRAVGAWAQTVDESAEKAGLERELIHLVKIRVSQVNGCAFCIDMHIIDARAEGVAEARIYLLDGWRHAGDAYSAREQAALDFAEAVTRLEQSGVGDEVYARVAAQFSQEQVAQLIFLASVMNTWNRLAVSARMQPGHYRRRAA